MTKIIDIYAREILDSRGNPTIEVKVATDDGCVGRAAVPSGVSTGSHEALELRDGDNLRYQGKGVLKAIGNANNILTKLKGHDIFGQKDIDRKMIEMDGTPNKKNLGANAILSVSLSVAKTAALAKKVPLWHYIAGIFGNSKPEVLPVPQMNILNGGAHTNWQTTDFQEFMIVPHGAPAFKEALRWGTEIYHTLKKILKEKNYSTNVGDEGGFAPQISSNIGAIDLILQSISAAGFKAGEQVSICIDGAVSALYANNKYNLKKEHKLLTGEELTGYYANLVQKYPILSIEDGFAEDDWKSWVKLTELIGTKISIVGDDLFATNCQRLKKGISLKAANAILVKVNQIGTLSETLETIKTAQSAGWRIIISHRSGETEDTFIADLAVATGSEFIKTGAPARSERVAKYNRLLEIAEELPMLGFTVRYKGKDAIFNI